MDVGTENRKGEERVRKSVKRRMRRTAWMNRRERRRVAKRPRAGEGEEEDVREWCWAGGLFHRKMVTSFCPIQETESDQKAGKLTVIPILAIHRI